MVDDAARQESQGVGAIRMAIHQDEAQELHLVWKVSLWLDVRTADVVCRLWQYKRITDRKPYLKVNWWYLSKGDVIEKAKARYEHIYSAFAK